MKTKILMASLLLCVLSSVSFAATKKTTGKVNGVSKKTLSPRAKLGTSFKFDGSALRGKYQSSLGTKTTVENDKMLDDLLNGRTQFEDRNKNDSERN